MDIYVNLNSINNAIEALNKNDKFLIIDGNVFSIENIKTFLNIKEKHNPILYGSQGTTCASSFSFSYNDGCISEIIEVIYIYENYRCLNYVKNCKLISDEEQYELWKKSEDISLKKFENKYGKRKDLLLITEKFDEFEVDEIFYNEFLLFISSKINENDKESTIDDFKSKYELYKNEKIKLTENTKNAFNKLHSSLIEKVINQ